MNSIDSHPIMEFSIGDHVTFKPYEHEYKRVVVNYVWNMLNTELLYALTMVDEPGFTSSNNTSGKCIKESKYYVPWEESENCRRPARINDGSAEDL